MTQNLRTTIPPTQAQTDMRLTMIFTFALTFLSFIPAADAASFTPDATYELCFTPGGNCTALITNDISKAKKSIYVQAYSFTSAPIASALAAAKKRGVDVNIILDKSQTRQHQYSSATFFQHQHIPLYIDNKPAIAHNKVMIIDMQTVITGSFNFTKAAQEKNAENVLIIHDANLAALYFSNWNNRKAQSMTV